MTQIDKLQNLLNREGATIAGVTLGDGPSTPEEIARSIRAAILAVKRGKGRDIDLSY